MFYTIFSSKINEKNKKDGANLKVIKTEKKNSLKVNTMLKRS